MPANSEQCVLFDLSPSVLPGEFPMVSVSCPSNEELQEWSSGLLADPACSSVGSHVQQCPRCVKRLDELSASDGFVADLQRAAQQPKEPPPDLLERRGLLGDLPLLLETVGGACDPTQATRLLSQSLNDITRRLLSPALRADDLGTLNEYRVQNVIGRGGMGLVLLAQDDRAGRPVAIKIMRPELAVNPGLKQRFEREAKTLAAVRSDHVVMIHHVGEAATPAGPLPYFVMEFLRGESLEGRLARGPLPVDEAIRLGRQIALGLAAIHSARLIHRDIKPGNIWLEDRTDGVRVRLLDFGLAWSAALEPALTGQGLLIGTPAYMSPEQAAGQRDLDHRSDLFSLGTVLYEMLTGQIPFRGETNQSILTAIAQVRPLAPAVLRQDIPESLSELVIKLIRKHPEERPQSAADVVRHLDEIAAELNPTGPVEASAVPVPRVPRLSRRRSGTGILPAAIMILAVAAVLFALQLRVETPHGTLVIESDDEDVAVRITRDGVVIRDATRTRSLRLAVGEYGIELVGAAPGLTLSAESITVTQDGRAPIRIRRERNKPFNAGERARASRPDIPAVASDNSVMAASAAGAATAAEMREPGSEYLLAEGRGRWRVTNGELWCAEPSGDSEDWLFFGWPEWTDYDFSIDASSPESQMDHGPGVFVRASVPRRAALVTFNVFRSGKDYFDEIDGPAWYSPWNDPAMPVHDAGKSRNWSSPGHRIQVRVRGKTAEVFLNEQPVLAFNRLRYAQGCVGIRSDKAWPHRYRHPVVTGPGGRILLEGWPPLPVELTAIDLDALRRFETWAVSRGGSVAPMSSPEQPLATRPGGPLPHMVGFSRPENQPHLTDGDLEAFQDLPGVENSLGFRDQKLTSAGLIRLGAILRGRRINGLGLVDMPIGLAWARESGGLAFIRTGTFQNIDARDADLIYLKRMRWLRTLTLRFNSGITDAAVPHLLELKSLRHLHLEGTGLSSDGVSRLKVGLPGVEITASVPVKDDR